jgi:hypothetical protein
MDWQKRAASYMWNELPSCAAFANTSTWCAIMKLTFFIVIVFLAGCQTTPRSEATDFRRHIPDTANSWAGRSTSDAFNLAKNLQIKFGLDSLVNGSKLAEFRLWVFSSQVDPQTLFILRKDTAKTWIIRKTRYYSSKNDSITYQSKQLLSQDIVNGLGILDSWKMASQSEMKSADSYGCMGGPDIFLEMADSSRYKFLWYRCPHINIKKHSSFAAAESLFRHLSQLSFDAGNELGN